ncbi:MAG TPA: Imm27 family immunity protein [Acidobacteriaceae bacterium]
MSILPEETELNGKWRWANGKMVSDDVSQRIQQLIKNRLELVTTSKDGWTKLYKDPLDGRLWELSYPHGEMHGGGPPRLRVVAADEIADSIDIGPSV